MKPIFSGQILGKREMETHEQINLAADKTRFGPLFSSPRRQR